MLAWMMMASAMAQTMDVTAASLQPVEQFVVDPDRYAGHGVQQLLTAPDGETFGVATVVFRMQWPDGVDQWRLENDDVALTVGDQSISPAGVIDWGRYKNSSPGRRVYASDMNPERTWSFVFPLASVPDNASLTLGEHAVPLELKPGIAALPPVVESLNLTVVGTEVLTELAGTIRRGPYEGATTYRPTSGRLVAVDVSAVATASNKEISGFFWQTTDLALAWDGGVAAPLGQWFMNKLSNSVSHNPRVGEEPTSPSRVFFVVPDGVTDANLLFHGQQAATVSIGS